MSREKIVHLMIKRRQTDGPSMKTNYLRSSSVQTNLLVLFVLTDDSSVRINAAQEETHFVDTCIQRSFQKKWREYNTTETSTSSYDI